MNGFINNLNELQLLIKEHIPDIISIRKIHCKHTFNPVAAKAYFDNKPCNTTSKQGECVLVRSNIPHKRIHINFSVQALIIAIQLRLKLGN